MLCHLWLRPRSIGGAVTHTEQFSRLVFSCTWKPIFSSQSNAFGSKQTPAARVFALAILAAFFYLMNLQRSRLSCSRAAPPTHLRLTGLGCLHRGSKSLFYLHPHTQKYILLTMHCKALLGFFVAMHSSGFGRICTAVFKAAELHLSLSPPPFFAPSFSLTLFFRNTDSPAPGKTAAAIFLLIFKDHLKWNFVAF